MIRFRGQPAAESSYVQRLFAPCRTPWLRSALHTTFALRTVGPELSVPLLRWNIDHRARLRSVASFLGTYPTSRTDPSKEFQLRWRVRPLQNQNRYSEAVQDFTFLSRSERTRTPNLVDLNLSFCVGPCASCLEYEKVVWIQAMKVEPSENSESYETPDSTRY